MRQYINESGTDSDQLSALFEYATEGIILTNEHGEIVLANPAALRLFKYAKGELIGKTIELLIPSRFQQHHESYRQGFYQKPSNRKMGHGRELFAKTSEGNEFPVDVSLSYYQHANEYFVIAFIVDITQQKHAQQELLQQKEALEKSAAEISKLNVELETKVEERTLILKEALQELERSQTELSEALNKEKELNEIKSRFVSMASHEFRTPLSTILSSAALIGRYVQPGEQSQRDKHIGRIKESVRHLNSLLEDFLSLGKLEEGQVTVHPSEFILQPFIDEISEELRFSTKEGQNINIQCEGIPSFCTDKRLLKNILLNIIGNAIKFSPTQTIVNVLVKHSRDQLELSVQDKGVGISKEDITHLFTSFFRGKNVSNIEGTGLGLHIVKRYVTLLGGSISLESTLGVGTTVNIILPTLVAGDKFDPKT